MTQTTIFDRLRALETQGQSLHALIGDACDAGNGLVEALHRAIKKLRAASLAGGTDPEFVEIMLEPFKAALDRAYADNGHTPDNGKAAA
jgi:hypothetical protein